MSGAPRPLRSTYRLQIAGLGFNDARSLIPYLAELGIETLYVSPILAAVAGSTHGYDVIDPTRLDPLLGTAEEFENLLAELDRHGMRLLIDIVPNHMATDLSNEWWADVLRRGETSSYAPFFDVDWSQHGGRVLVPTLARPLGEAESAIGVRGSGDEKILVIDGQDFPAAPETTVDSDDLLAARHFRPAFWKLSNREGNYRRFFDIDGLVGLRVEDDEVFARTHSLIESIGMDERVAGWRVDHVDGLYDPAVYLERLSRLTDTRTDRATVLVEKIVATDEELPRAWSVEGTTGYEFAAVAGGLFVNEQGAHVLAEFGHDVTGEMGSFHELSLAAKREVIATSFDASFARLARLAMVALDEATPGHDLSAADVRRALEELSVHLGVYRTYVQGVDVTPGDRRRIVSAAQRAAAALNSEAKRALDIIVAMALAPRDEGLELVRFWQQLTGGVMAKGVEDTATYRYNGLLSHAEVGSDPDNASVTVAAFHDFASRPARRSSLNATSTHDSKRSEDARARLFVLSEVTNEWSTLVGRWRRRYRDSSRAAVGPDGHEDLVLFQSVLCLWPADDGPFSPALRLRLLDYLIKAAREAKIHTSWGDPNLVYERRLRANASRIVADPRFAGEMSRFVRRTAAAATTNSLALTVLKCVAPGVPDFYQGSELWDFALTDPDNRRTVDYDASRAALTEVAASRTPGEHLAWTRQLVKNSSDGRIKLHLAHQLLELRRRQVDLFANGAYEPLVVEGPFSDHIMAFARRRHRNWVVAIVPRLVNEVAGPGRFALGVKIWGDTTKIRLPETAPAGFTNVLTGAAVAAKRGRLRLEECLVDFPVAVLES